MTAVRPEGRRDTGYGQQQPYGGPEPDGWGVYETAQTAQLPVIEPQELYRPGPAQQGDYPWLADQTLQLRAIAVDAAPADGEAAAAGRADRRRAQGGVSMRSGNGRRRAAGRRSPVPRPKEAKGVIAARLVGELCITLGLVMLLFVSYQLWWTNVQADASASSARNKLEKQWAAPAAPAPGAPAPKDPGVFAPGQGFAILFVPKLGLQYPIAEGTDTEKVLNKGLVGHYTGTAMPADASGNFAVAAHRTTHGQPFRRLAELGPGDKVVVETATSFYTYEVEGGIPETSPTNVTVLQPIPKGSPFSQPGRYLTMTTCTPEFSARGRLIVFGKMIAEQPRSQGQPPALTTP